MSTPNQQPQRPTPQSTAEIHLVDDVDTSPTSHHHTLGYSPVQAAPGNHQHTGENSPILTDYALKQHSHIQGDVQSLISDLGGKASTDHSATHESGGADAILIAQNQVIDLGTALAGKADTNHGNHIAGIPVAVSGSRGGNVALANLLTALASVGIVTDNTVV